MIDLSLLYSNEVEKIYLDGEYVIPSSFLEESNIFELSKITLKDSYISKVDNDLFVNLNISGKMKIEDSISLEKVWYSFNIVFDDKLDEFIEKNENSLDIIAILWQNIVLEVPLRYTLVDNYNEYQGDGWKLVSEEELVKNNPFNTLLEDEDRSD